MQDFTKIIRAVLEEKYNGWTDTQKDGRMNRQTNMGSY